MLPEPGYGGVIRFQGVVGVFFFLFFFLYLSLFLLCENSCPITFRKPFPLESIKGLTYLQLRNKCISKMYWESKHIFFIFLHYGHWEVLKSRCFCGIPQSPEIDIPQYLHHNTTTIINKHVIIEPILSSTLYWMSWKTYGRSIHGCHPESANSTEYRIIFRS